VLEDRSLHSLEVLQGLCPIFKPKAIRTAPLVRLEQPQAIFKGSARSSNEVIFQLKAIYRLKADLQTK
jgi:hypothetical protein